MQKENLTDTTNYALVIDDVFKVISDRSDQISWQEYSDKEWTLFLDICSEGGISPLLYWQFKDGDWPPGIPHQLTAEAIGQFFTTCSNNEIIFSDLGRIIKFFEQNSIPVLVLKGAALAGEIYEDIGLRPMGDLDLLVQRKDIYAAYDLFEQLGFKKSSIELWQGTDQDFWHESLLTNDEGRFVEVHWNLIGSDYDKKAPPIEYLWDHKQQIRIPNSDQIFFTVNDYIHIVYGCAHIALQHGISESRLIWYYDIYRLLGSLGENLDWGVLRDTAQELGWCTSLLLVLEKVCGYFDFPVPPSFMSELSKIHSADKDLISENGLAHERSGRAAQIISSLSWPYKIKFVISHLFPSPSRMRYRYNPKPEWIWPLYYPYRWAFIIGTFLRSAERIQ